MKTPLGCVALLTGLSGSGKTTLSIAAAEQLTLRMYPVQVLDGDAMRLGLCSDLGYTLADRHENTRRVAHVAAILSRSGINVLVALMCPLQSMRDLIRSVNPTMIEVFVNASVETCKRRDVKGLYKRALEGKIFNITGIDSPFEFPIDADLVCHTDYESIDESTTKITAALMNRLRLTHSRSRMLPRQPTIAVDLDGVIAEYKGWEGHEVWGEARTDVLNALNVLRTEGWKIIVHTCRPVQATRMYLDAKKVDYDEINCNSDYSTSGSKPVATVYWDDRAVFYSGDAIRDLARIREFRTWDQRE